MTIGLMAIAVFTMLFTMVAKRLSSTMITAPMLFMAFGFLLHRLGFIAKGDAEGLLHVVAEVALILLLFLDAAKIELTSLRLRHVWPQRMLLLGLPLAILLGTAAAWLFLPGNWSLVTLALVAALLAPTDAALGQSVVSNQQVPERVRHGLTVESGLNDGLALPAILLFASLVMGTEGSGDDRNWYLFAASQLILGPVVGIAMGYAGGQILLFAKKHELTADVYEGVGAIALACGTYLMAEVVDGNGFIAAFVAGLTFGNVIKGRCKFIFEFTESEGQLLAWAAFLLLGLVLIPGVIGHLTLPMLGFILTSLFVVRPIAIWISLMGTDASPMTRVFFGWFGPRGLATALFALLILPELGHALTEPILAIAINTVWISALLHGLSAAPLANLYARKIAQSGDCPEKMPVTMAFAEQRTRTGVLP